MNGPCKLWTAIERKRSTSDLCAEDVNRCTVPQTNSDCWMTKICIDGSASNVSVELRFLCPDDLPTVRLLCKEWFPIAYPKAWYEDITSNPRFFSLSATLNNQIVGLIVAEIKPQFRCNVEDQGLLSKQFSKQTPVAYILTLGVVKEHRRNGIATLLLDNFIEHLTTTKECKAVYLHVLTTNVVAIRFYEKRQFRRHLYLPLYYYIDGEGKDGFSYVLYINGGYHPWILLYPFLKETNVPPRLCRSYFLNVMFNDYLSPFYRFFAETNPWKCVKRIINGVATFLLKYIPGIAFTSNKARRPPPSFTLGCKSKFQRCFSMPLNNYEI